MKPIIGITVDYAPSTDEPKRTGGGKLCLNWNYAQSVADAGGIPLLIPPQAEPDEIASLIDGLLIPGGNDIDASNWGEENHPEATPIEPERFNAEKDLFSVLPADIPVFGICYGCQFINVMRGGTINQHIPDDPTKKTHTKGVLQEYEVEGGSKLQTMSNGGKMLGESWHHQAVRDLGKGLKIVAFSEDETVEAIEAQDRPWMIGVQWHPERTQEIAENKRLFEEFVAAAARYKESKAKAPALK